MSVKRAMQFIQRLRADESLRNKIQSLGGAANLESIIELAGAAGYAFSVEDLQSAFKHDWAMRWFYYNAQSRAEDT